MKCSAVNRMKIVVGDVSIHNNDALYKNVIKFNENARFIYNFISYFIIIRFIFKSSDYYWIIFIFSSNSSLISIADNVN